MSLLCRLKNLVHKGILKEKDLERIVIIPKGQEPCEDAISRQIISDYVESHIQEINTGYGDLNKHTNEILRMIVDYIEKMESVTPKPKTDVLDKIRAEIIENSIEDYKYHGCGTDELIIETSEVLRILDKYKAESEDKE